MKTFSISLITFLLLLNCLAYPQSNKISNPNIIYLSPVPNSQMNSPLSDIIIRVNNGINKQTVNVNNLIVTGDKSGVHNGKLIVADNDSTLVFNPYTKFAAGETVNVYLKNGLEDIWGNPVGDYSFNFCVSKFNLNSYKGMGTYLQNELENQYKVENSNKRIFKTEGLKKVNDDSLNLPSDFPQLYISVLSNPSPGYIFMSNFDISSFNPSAIKTTQPYLMILDNSGKPFYYKKMSGYCIDFTMQPNGLLTYFDSRVGYFYGMNNHYTIVDSFYSHQYATDFHELQILPNGHYLIIADDHEVVDMSQIVAGGDTNAVVTGIIIQELDENKNLVFQWRSWDHFKITDATSDINLTDSTIDYAHTNAIELDSDGNLLISSRHMDEVTKINITTGDIMWRLGGKNNQFKFIYDDVGFSHQHDIRRLPNGDITLFDDGNLHWSMTPSRAIQYTLDVANKTATADWRFINSPYEYSEAMGNVQRLADGNTLIGWGTGAPAVTEVTPAGLKELELSLPQNVFNYRAFRFKLDSTYYVAFMPVPDYPQNGIIIPDTAITLQWRKNKFAQSFHIQVATDSSFSDLIYDSTDFKDTSLTFDSLQDGVKYYWHVLSNNNTDSVGGYSAYSKVFTFTTLLKNTSELKVYSTANAVFLNWSAIADDADSVIIERKGGSDTVNYKIIAELPKNVDYFVDTKPDTVNVISNQYIYRIETVNNYSCSKYTYSRAVYWGVTGVKQGNSNLPVVYSLSQNFPNPFNPATTINYSIPKASLVTLKVYDILGREIETLVNEEKPAGNYKAVFNADKLTSGIYFYKIQAGGYTSVKKMVLLK